MTDQALSTESNPARETQPPGIEGVLSLGAPDMAEVDACIREALTS